MLVREEEEDMIVDAKEGLEPEVDATAFKVDPPVE